MPKTRLSSNVETRLSSNVETRLSSKIRRWFFPLLAVLILSFGLTPRVFATPDPPRAAINPSTLECVPSVYWRDECRELLLPAGWEYTNSSTCPAGYTEIARFDLEILRFQNDYCCRQSGGDFCPETMASPSPLVTLNIEPETPTALPTPVETSTDSNALPIAGGLFLLAGLGLGAYALLRRKRN